MSERDGDEHMNAEEEQKVRGPPGQDFVEMTVNGILQGDTAIIRADKRDSLGHPMDYRTLNLLIRKLLATECRRIVIEGALGQRYIGSTSSRPDVRIEVYGTPGNNLGAFLDGSTIEVFGNAQDMTGNTMNSGKIIVHGNAWDVTGLAARGGTILVKGNSGYRVGIHMKEFAGTKPVVVIGGTAKDYLGEYMAGGIILVLRLGMDDRSPLGSNIGVGMHGGRIIVRGKVSTQQIGLGAAMEAVGPEDVPHLEVLADEFEEAFDLEVPRKWSDYTRVSPTGHRPFHGHYDPTLI
ncbi:MAG: hypothetical protein FJ151_04200 [Euryarchaeota archaeon]|nr:hypothetical protein [Euryarchaeota archaeon]